MQFIDERMREYLNLYSKEDLQVENIVIIAAQGLRDKGYSIDEIAMVLDTNKELVESFTVAPMSLHEEVKVFKTGGYSIALIAYITRKPKNIIRMLYDTAGTKQYAVI